MRILLTADPGLPVPPTGYGGIERIVDALVRAYRNSGHEVALAAHEASTSPATAHFAWPDAARGTFAALFSPAWSLRRAVGDFRPDILHSFSRLAFLTPLLPARLPKLMSYQRHTGGRQIAVAARIAGPTLRFTGCSEFITRMGRQAGGDWTTVPNFVEPERFTFVAKVPSDAPLVFLSRVESIKGPDTAIAIARRAGRRLLIAGNRPADGAERTFWDREVAPHLGRHGIDYVGEVNDEEKNALLGRAAALLVPVRWDEPFGIVFAEALAAGCPVISCPRGALPEIVEPGRTGFLIRDTSEGVAAVGALARIDRRACRAAAESRFSAKICSRQYLELYAQMMRSP